MPRNNYRKVFTKVEGNYMVHSEEGYYVGESEDLFRRLHEHTSRGRAIVAVLVNQGGKQSRLEVEREMISSLENGSGDVLNVQRCKGRRR